MIDARTFGANRPVRIKGPGNGIVSIWGATAHSLFSTKKLVRDWILARQSKRYEQSGPQWAAISQYALLSGFRGGVVEFSHLAKEEWIVGEL
jgi:hypothetical protein